MKSKNSDRKLDRRTIYTKTSIKNALLEVKNSKPFNSITVTEICQAAEINRGTFYLHYYDIYDVLDDLLTEFLEDTGHPMDSLICDNEKTVNECTYPLCQKIQMNPKYKVLFLDDSITCHIVKKIYDLAKDDFIKKLTAHSNLTSMQAEAIFIFQINGCFAVNKAMNWNSDGNWCQTQSIIDEFIQNGLEKYIDNNRM